MNDCISVDIDAHIAHVQLNRPEKRNAVSLELFKALARVGEQIESDRRVRAVVLSGAGDHFCAGIDTSLFSGTGPAIRVSDMAPQDPSPANLFQRVAYIWREVSVPVVCAIQGVAFGAGLQIALGADIRFASPAAQLSIMEIKWGLIPDMAITVTARNIVPADRLKELAFTGRIVTGTEAFELGLVTALHDDPVAAAQEATRDIAAKSPHAIRAMKNMFNTAWNLPEPEALALEARLQLSLLGTDNQREAIQANIEKRPPDFSD